MSQSLETLVEKESSVQQSWLSRTGRFLADNAVTTAAILTLSHPAHVIMERALTRISTADSMTLRRNAAVFLLCGLTYMVESGRQYSRRQLGVQDTDPESVQQRHDLKYSVALCAAITPPLLALGGVFAPKDVLMLTGLELTYAATLGGPVGYAIDAFRDAFGFERTPRLPNVLQAASRTVKVGLAAAAMTAAWMGANGVYQVMDAYFPK